MDFINIKFNQKDLNGIFCYLYLIKILKKEYLVEIY